MEDLQRIKERIAKLLAMAADASSPNEAAIAASRARALMDKHQISEYDVSDAVTEAFETADVTRVFAAVPYHIDILAVAVARYNDCQAVRVRDFVTYKLESKRNQNAKMGNGAAKQFGFKIVFRGYKNDVYLAKEMFERLCQNIDALCKVYMTANHPGRYNVRIGGEYKAGCASQLCQRFRELMVEREQLTTSGGTALVVVKTASVDEHFGGADYKDTSKKSSVKSYEDQADNAAARFAGYMDAASIEINKRLDD